MDINTLAAWGEFIGGIAVVISLVYLASQIRQNSRLLQVSTTAALADSDNLMSSLMVQDPELIRIYRDGVGEGASLSEAENDRFNWYVEMRFRGFLRNYQFAKAGVLDGGVWEAELKGQTLQLQQPGVRTFWNEHRHIYGSEFSEFVDGLIREGEAAG